MLKADKGDAFRWKAKRLSFLWKKYFLVAGQKVDSKRRKQFEDNIYYCLRLPNKPD
ncbi:MAG: hypothetical protein NUV80_06075 [Candidatus Berkelbacteria bacterium]|nr:hypothetical protein [Candidatus Berkelbacteria bacterium]